MDKTIVQVIPCLTPMYNVYEHDDDTYEHEPVALFGTDLQGGITSLSSNDGYFTFASDASNFLGCVCENNLKNYPTKAQVIKPIRVIAVTQLLADYINTVMDVSMELISDETIKYLSSDEPLKNEISVYPHGF